MFTDCNLSLPRVNLIVNPDVYYKVYEQWVCNELAQCNRLSSFTFRIRPRRICCCSIRVFLGTHHTHWSAFHRVLPKTICFISGLSIRHDSANLSIFLFLSVSTHFSNIPIRPIMQQNICRYHTNATRHSYFYIDTDITTILIRYFGCRFWVYICPQRLWMRGWPMNGGTASIF